ncbi:MAG: nitrous oxide reductase accessory protein NosL [Methylococcaceae bacterium]|nr:nitrous oxide reductase accessory protein NosL [Methylococcaceae bacterium]
MKMRTTFWIVLACQLLIMPVWTLAVEPGIKTVAASLEAPRKRETCKVCGMYIDEYIKSAAELTYKDGSKAFTCGVACMLREVEDAGGISAFQSVKVHDWVSGNLVDAETATYVVGSKVIPDMVPNYIAFANRSEAEAFAVKEGGDVIGFNIAYEDISPVGTTAPFRLRTAVTPGAGNFSVGMVYGYTTKDSVKNGSGSSDPTQFIYGNRAQPQAPHDSHVHMQALTVNYSPTDNLALFMNIPWFERRASTLTQSAANQPRAFNETLAEENGIGDIAIEGRYNFWRSTRWDKFASLLLGVSLPTGEFNGDRTRSAPLSTATFNRYLVSRSAGMQLGKDTATFTGGLLYSERWKDFWLHLSALHTVNPENGYQFKYGDVTTGGLALHYTPNYDLMLGVEIDSSYTQKNEDLGYQVGNSGGVVTNLAFVGDYRFLNAFGGNFKLRGSVGLPIYEDLNSLRVVTNRNTGAFLTQVQPGDGFFGNLAIQWTFRDAPNY